MSLQILNFIKGTLVLVFVSIYNLLLLIRFSKHLCNCIYCFILSSCPHVLEWEEKKFWMFEVKLHLFFYAYIQNSYMQTPSQRRECLLSMYTFTSRVSAQRALTVASQDLSLYIFTSRVSAQNAKHEFENLNAQKKKSCAAY